MKSLTPKERQALIRVQNALNKQLSRKSGYGKSEIRNFGDMFQDSVIPYESYFAKHPELTKLLHIKINPHGSFILDDTAKGLMDIQGKALTHKDLANRIENVLLEDDVNHGDDLSKLDKLLLQLEKALIKQEKVDEKTHSNPDEKKNFWNDYEKNVFPYILFLDRYTEVKHALHVITAENMYKKPFLKGNVYDSRSQMRLTHHDLLWRILMQQEHKTF